MINNVLNNKLQIINLTDTNMDIKISDVPGETSFASAMGEEAFKQFRGLEMTAYSGCRASFTNEILNNASIFYNFFKNMSYSKKGVKMTPFLLEFHADFKLYFLM